MTRHNLDLHISWLLSHKVTPPVSVHLPPPANSVSATEDIADILDEEIEEIPRVPPGHVANNQISQTVDVQSFVRPPPRSSTIIPPPQLRDQVTTLVDGSMGKLASAQRSKRPGLMSQQLATPASTTASNPSLTQSYSKSFVGQNGKLGYITVMKISNIFF